MIIDSQVHVWKEETPDRPWPTDGRRRQHLPYPLTYEKMLHMMDDAGVDRAIIVPPSWEGDCNDYALEAAQRFPDRFAVMGRLTLTDPKAKDLLSRWLDDRGMLGIRLNFTNAQVEPLRQGLADWLWPLAAEAGIPIMAHTATVMPEMIKIANSYPTLRLIIDHMGLSSEIARTKQREAAIERTLAFASCPNVAVKLSDAPVYSYEAFPFRDMEPFICKIIDAFGDRRCFWGTDVSHSLKYASYRQSVTHFTEHLDFLTEDNKKWVMGRSIATYLGWGK